MSPYCKAECLHKKQGARKQAFVTYVWYSVYFVLGLFLSYSSYNRYPIVHVSRHHNSRITKHTSNIWVWTRFMGSRVLFMLSKKKINKAANMLINKCTYSLQMLTLRGYKHRIFLYHEMLNVLSIYFIVANAYIKANDSAGLSNAIVQAVRSMCCL